MSIVASDIKIYGSASMPDDNSTLDIGGAIDVTKKIEFTDISPAGTLQALSSSAGDTTQTLTIVGRDAAGVLQTETKTLTGTTAITFSFSLERLLKATLSAGCAGTISIRETVGGEVLATLETGIITLRRPFYNATAPAAGTIKFYEKIFFKNTHGTLALTDATISELSDPTGKIAFALEASLGASGSNGGGNNRLVAPAGLTFNSSAKDIANSKNHTAGASQGVWLELTLASTDASLKSTYGLTETGVTT